MRAILNEGTHEVLAYYVRPRSTLREHGFFSGQGGASIFPNVCLAQNLKQIFKIDYFKVYCV